MRRSSTRRRQNDERTKQNYLRAIFVIIDGFGGRVGASRVVLMMFVDSSNGSSSSSSRLNPGKFF